MPSTRLAVLSSLLLAAACAGEPEPFERVASGPAEPSQIRFQAVDAGTGGALADRSLTVRYLVRAPITLDATAVEETSASEPYTVRHEVADDSLVLEVRLEAPSYHRLDTVLAVARGAEGGPYTLRMARRLERVADAAPGRPTPTRPTPTRPTPAQAEPATSGPATGPTTEPATGAPDRAALDEGNRAFEAGRFNAAIAAYQRMDPPVEPSGPYARAYQEARVRQGVAHINRGEFGGALEALEEAVDLDIPNAQALRRLGQAQCAVGRVDEGLGTLSALTRVARRLPGRAQPQVLALRQYQVGVCAQQEFAQAEGAVALVRTGGQAVRELEAFLEEAEALPNRPPLMEEAMSDARSRIEDIRARIRRGGDHR